MILLALSLKLKTKINNNLKQIKKWQLLQEVV